jgi:hypothetical protein
MQQKQPTNQVHENQCIGLTEEFHAMESFFAYR